MPRNIANKSMLRLYSNFLCVVLIMRWQTNVNVSFTQPKGEYVQVRLRDIGFVAVNSDGTTLDPLQVYKAAQAVNKKVKGLKKHINRDGVQAKVDDYLAQPNDLLQPSKASHLRRETRAPVRFLIYILRHMQSSYSRIQKPCTSEGKVKICQYCFHTNFANCNDFNIINIFMPIF